MGAKILEKNDVSVGMFTRGHKVVSNIKLRGRKLDANVEECILVGYSHE